VIGLDPVLRVLRGVVERSWHALIQIDSVQARWVTTSAGSP
jgi:hypothetical protein